MPTADERIAALRAFNRFYTRRIGVLHEGLLDSRFSLTESRLLWELAHCEHTTATALAQALDLDPGYLSRLLRGLKERGLLKASRSASDARQTGCRSALPAAAPSRRWTAARRPRWRRCWTAEATRSSTNCWRRWRASKRCSARAPGHAALRAARAPPRRHRLGGVAPRRAVCAGIRLGPALRGTGGADRAASSSVRRRARSLLDRRARRQQPRLRVPGAGPRRSHAGASSPAPRSCACCWWSRQRVAWAWAWRWSTNASALRARWVTKRIRLWTNSLLLAARGIYQRAGYKLLASEPHHSFGHDLVGETWELSPGLTTWRRPGRAARARSREVGDEHQAAEDHQHEGDQPRDHRSSGIRATVQAANRLTPKGGVIMPSARLTTMMMPKCTGSMPKCWPPAPGSAPAR